MPSHTSDLPALGDHGTQEQHLSRTQTPMEPESNAWSGGCDDTNEGEQGNVSSENDLDYVMALLGSLAVVPEEAQDGSSQIESTDLLVTCLLAQAEICEENFERLNTIEWIEKAIESRRLVLALTQEEHEERNYRLGKLGVALYNRFDRMGEPADVNESIECLTEAVLLTPDGHPDKPALLSNLGNSTRRRFKHFGELEDVDKSIKYHSQAVLLAPDDHPVKPLVLNNLGNSHRCRFERLDGLADVEKAIECQTQAVLLAPDDHLVKPLVLNNLGNSHQCRFERLGELADLEKAIDYHTQSVLLTPNGHWDKPTKLNNLGKSHQCRFERLGELEDVDKAIDCHAQAVLLTPDGHPDKPWSLSGLGSSHMYRFERLGELANVDKAIGCNTQAVMLSSDSHPGKPGYLSSLGDSLQCRFGRLDELADDKTVECQIQAGLQLTPDDHPNKPTGLNNPGNSHQRTFGRPGELAEVDEANECHNRTVPDSHPDKPNRLHNLGNSHRYRSGRLRRLTGVDKAIEYHTQAVLLTPEGHPDKPSYLNSLGNSYLYRFERHGDLADVDKAIERHAEAVMLTCDGHPDKPIYLTCFGNSLMRRFERLRELADVDKAIKYQTQAVQLTPDDHSGKLNKLNSLGNSHQCRFELLGELADVDTAIECHTRAVLSTPDGHPDKFRLLHNLGSSHRYRFGRLRELADVNKAIECHIQAVLLTPEVHPDRPGMLYGLASAYRCRFECLDELADVDNAIEYQTQAVVRTPDGHPSKPNLLNNLAEFYMARFHQSGAREDLESAKSSYQAATQHTITNPTSQIQSAHSWAKCLILLELSPLMAYQRSMELIPHVIWIGSTINQRYSLLTTISGLTTEAASWAISVQAYDLAIEWLEQGRSVVWNQILLFRTPFDELDGVDHVLAQSMRDIASQLERAGLRPPPASSFNDTLIDLDKDAQHHRRLAEEWEQLLRRARDIPGFHDFMRPRRAEELKRAATNGPVVLINAHSTCWDALIIFPECDDIVHLPLFDPLQDNVDEPLAHQYPASLVRYRGERVGGFGNVKQGTSLEPPLRALLEALWVVVVKPVLDVLACTRKLPVEELPHVTWCATGALSSAALHAAGPYDGSSPSAFDLVVSSYTPTLSALLARRVPPPESDFGVLAVGQENTWGFPPLPSTVPELSAIKRHAKATRFKQLNDRNASVDAVLDAMVKYSCVHLACHATQDPVNPAQSAFHLSDGNLTLEAIMRRRFKNKSLAFLSACQTAKGDSSLPDEAVHLAAGMLMAGYPSVIATMWSIWDVDGPEVAERVYAELLADGQINPGATARALHKAVDGLRQKIGEGLFERWVPFIHIGL